MNFISRCAWPALVLAAASLDVAAAPGAHGPGGEHIDVAATAGSASALPRLEAKSEAFELLAVLSPTELSVLIDRYETNEPVLGGTLEVESGGIKAKAAFKAERGDYAVNDPALLKRLALPGEHAIVFTLAAGPDSDLLDGTLLVAKPPAAAGGSHGHDHAHAHGLERAAWVAAGIAAVGLLGGVAWWRQRRRPRAAVQGEQQ